MKSVGQIATETISGGETCEGTYAYSNLRFKISSFTTESAYLPFESYPGELLVDAICCDKNFEGYAEPRDFYAYPDVDFFVELESMYGDINEANPVTLYDSVCGIPLFVVPKDRTWQDFKDDTVEHGWPSFRGNEVVADHVIITNNSQSELAPKIVSSICGTRLGTFEPDDSFNIESSESDVSYRYCMDVTCIAGTGYHPLTYKLAFDK